MKRHLKNNIISQKNNSPDRRKLWTFRFMSFVFSLAILLAFELILRLVGYGHDLRLFTECSNDKTCWQMNEYASSKFFTDEENTTVADAEPFKKIKENHTYRIFVLGESTTAGFPYYHNGSFHRWLKYRLMFAFPDKNFELINLSLTAVNSYTINDFAKSVVKYQPDAVLIYVGHNEYYGALGVGSTSRLGKNPFIVNTILKLRSLRIFQFLMNISNTIKHSFSGNKHVDTKSLMVRMPADKEIHYNTKEFFQGIEQFKYNINKTLETLSSCKIPVFISNVVCNEKDLKPFISDTLDQDYSANYQYKLAQQLYNSGDYSKAKESYVNAKEFDLLRFRAPEAINQTISDLSTKYPGVYLVDTKSYFENTSPHGIIGNETLLEHVHPNLFGYALLSEAFFESLKKYHMISSDWSKAMSFQELLDQMPVTIIDSLRGIYTERIMKNSWPFCTSSLDNANLIKPKTEIENITNALVFDEISWNKAMVKLGDIYKSNGNLKGELKFSEAMVLEYPLKEQSYKIAAELCLKANEKQKAIFYLGKDFNLNPSNEAAKQLALLCFEKDEPELAIKYLSYINSSKDNRSNISSIIKIGNEIVKLKNQLIKDENNVDILNNIALKYLKIGQFSMANKYATIASEKNKKDINSKMILAKIDELSKAVGKHQK